MRILLLKGTLFLILTIEKNYGADDFPDGSTAAQINTARTAAKTAAANDANNNDTKKSYQRYFF